MKTIASLYEMIGTSVNIQDKQGNIIQYDCPLNDEGTLRQLLPLLLDTASTHSNPEIPARVNVNTAPLYVLAGLPGLVQSDVETIVLAASQLVVEPGAGLDLPDTRLADYRSEFHARGDAEAGAVHHDAVANVPHPVAGLFRSGLAGPARRGRDRHQRRSAADCLLAGLDGIGERFQCGTVSNEVEDETHRRAGGVSPLMLHSNQGADASRSPEIVTNFPASVIFV